MKKFNLFIITFSFTVLLSSCSNVSQNFLPSSSNNSTSIKDKNSSINSTLKDSSSQDISIVDSTITKPSSSRNSSSSNSHSNNTSSNVDNFTIKNLRLNNKSVEFTLNDDSITTYFYPNGNVPYVGIKEFIDSLDGYYDSSLIEYKWNENISTLSWKYGEETNWLEIDSKNDIIKTNQSSFFGFLKDQEGIYYGDHIQTISTDYKSGNDITYDIGKYGFDILFIEDDILLPFNILVPLGIMSNFGNMFYNGKEYYFYSTYIDDYSSLIDIRNTSLEGKKIPSDLLEARNNGLYFILDYFYGLKNEKSIDNFNTYINSKPYSNKLKNNNAVINEKGLIEFLLKDLDEGHTYTGCRSFYTKLKHNDPFIPYDEFDVGPRVLNITQTYWELYDYYYDKFHQNPEDGPLVRYEGNTAFIKFDSFTVGYEDEIFNPDGTLKEDAYLYDTYYLMKHCLDEIRQKNAIKNVVIDLSMNGGGVISACYESLGFLTNKDIVLSSKDLLTNETITETIKVDSDDDSYFDDNDAYDEFKYFVLTSNATYSAASYFACVCKDMNLATIIGEDTGGGMCAVSEIALLDGTTFSFSSTYCLNGNVKKENTYDLYDIEYGIKVDKKISKDKFYDLTYLNNFVNTL